MSDTPSDVTQLLTRHVEGDALAAEQLLPLVYEELRGLARGYMARERPDHTLQPTALVNEAWLRMVQIEQIDWRGRAHFLAMAATTLRRVLVDHARARVAQKRGQGLLLQPLNEEAALVAADETVELLDVDVALERLAQASPRQARVVELRCFGGLSVDEAAAVLGVGRDRVKEDWRFARAWLRRELEAMRGSAR